MFICKWNYTGFICMCLFFAKALSSALSNVGHPCDPSSLVDEQCPPTEQCDATAKTCQCLPTYNNENGTCVEPHTTPNYSSLVDNQGNGSLIAGILIPLFLMTFVICSIYIGKRFELVKWLRHRLNQRNRNYDEFMIGQDDDDDPPLA